MYDPCLIVVDASGSRNEVYSKVVDCIKQKLPQLKFNTEN